jgi:uncharacterized protein
VKLDGSIQIAADAASVWAVVIDPVSLSSCVPGVSGVRQVDPSTFEGSISAAVGPIEGNFAFTSVLAEVVFPDRLVVGVDGIDSVTRSRLHADVRASLVATAPDRTEFRYAATITVKGRLAILGEMVLRATANAIIGQVVKCLRSRVEPATVTTSADAGR